APGGVSTRPCEFGATIVNSTEQVLNAKFKEKIANADPRLPSLVPLLDTSQTIDEPLSAVPVIGLPVTEAPSSSPPCQTSVQTEVARKLHELAPAFQGRPRGFLRWVDRC
ncbi:MAG: hypothetical protein WBX25_25825, partial [Rhodomicrobium sp.]